MSKADLERYFTLKEQLKDNKEFDNRRPSNALKKMVFKNYVNKLKDAKASI